MIQNMVLAGGGIGIGTPTSITFSNNVVTLSGVKRKPSGLAYQGSRYQNPTYIRNMMSYLEDEQGTVLVNTLVKWTKGSGSLSSNAAAPTITYDINTKELSIAALNLDTCADTTLITNVTNWIILY